MLLEIILAIDHLPQWCYSDYILTNLHKSNWINQYQLTLHPAFPSPNAIALPIPLEAPVTITTGDSTFCAASTLVCSTVETWAFMPAQRIKSKNTCKSVMHFPNATKKLIKHKTYASLSRSNKGHLIINTVFSTSLTALNPSCKFVKKFQSLKFNFHPTINRIDTFPSRSSEHSNKHLSISSQQNSFTNFIPVNMHLVIFLSSQLKKYRNIHNSHTCQLQI